MNIKRILLLVLLVIVIIGGINLMGSRQKPEFKGIHNLSIVPLGEQGYRYTGWIEVYNPSIFQLRLSAINLQFELNQKQVGTLENPINLNISAKETGRYPFELRFNKTDFDITNATTLAAHFKGSLSNTSLFSKVNVNIDTIETVTIK